jgi:hypothetical protein
MLSQVLLASWVAGVIAGVNYPPIPKDLTTPTQQRLAYNGPNGKVPEQTSFILPEARIF